MTIRFAKKGSPQCRKIRSQIWHRLAVAAGVVAVAAVITPAARASFSGVYSVPLWTFTNSDNGFGAGTNGSVTTPDAGATVTLTGGNSGNGLFGGSTDFVTKALVPGMVQFHYAYSSLDPSSNRSLGCGPSLGACDGAGYLLNGQFHPLADDLNQTSGNISFSVNPGDTFGFRVTTEDNQGEPGILTLSNFTAPLPVVRILLAQAPTAVKSGSTYVVTVPISNQSNLPLPTVTLTSATLGAAKTAGVIVSPNPVTNVAIGATSSFSVSFTLPAGTVGPLSLSGTYSAGALTGGWTLNVRSVTLP